MNVNEAIARVDARLPNRIERREKVTMLSVLDRKLIGEVLSRYPAAVYDKNFEKYDPDQDGSTELVVPSPYDEMYIHYVSAEVYLILHEQKHYNNERAIFESILADYKVHLIRNLRPGGVSRYKVR